MKRKIFLLIGIISFSILNAQTTIDALRYSSENIQGTARFNSLGGAFGALGGDISSIDINPAGSSVFLQNTMTATFSVFSKRNANTYFNTTLENDYSDFDISNLGAVFVFDNPNQGSDWKKFTLGINFNTHNNFDNEVFVSGNNSESIGNFFLNQAQGIPLDLLELRSGESISELYAFLGETEGTEAQNAFLGYQAFIFDPVEEDASNTAYTSNFGTGTYNQDYALLTRGYSGKYSFNISTQYKDDYYFGINFNAHTIDYRHTSFLFEGNNNGNSSIKEIDFENSLSTLGNGFSMQAGTIAKINENVRVGLTYDSPTWFTISEETTQVLETTLVENGESSNIFISPNIINVFNDYKLKSPGKISASAAYIFGRTGLLSVDYSYKDFSSIKFRPTSDTYFQSLNQVINSSFKGASTIKVGGEYRIQWVSLRGGLRFSESPYKDKDIIDDRKGYSLGLGFNFGNYNLDFAFVRTEQKSEEQIFNSNFSTPYSSNNNENNFLFTLGLNL